MLHSIFHGKPNFGTLNPLFRMLKILKASQEKSLFFFFLWWYISFRVPGLRRTIVSPTPLVTFVVLGLTKCLSSTVETTGLCGSPLPE